MKDVKKYGIECHEKVNHFYGEFPYSKHLNDVYLFAEMFIYLVDDEFKEHVLNACWVHDVIEDCRQTYNDVLNNSCFEVAEIAYALSNEKGKTRKERANKKYYSGIRKTNGATFVKICDRLANVKHSKDSGSSMFEKYKKEHREFENELYTTQYLEMWIHMDFLLEI